MHLAAPPVVQAELVKCASGAQWARCEAAGTNHLLNAPSRCLSCYAMISPFNTGFPARSPSSA
eukprot:3096189-Lingulodinium_polyedra.AAC.1